MVPGKIAAVLLACYLGLVTLGVGGAVAVQRFFDMASIADAADVAQVSEEDSLKMRLQAEILDTESTVERFQQILAEAQPGADGRALNVSEASELLALAIENHRSGFRFIPLLKEHGARPTEALRFASSLSVAKQLKEMGANPKNTVAGKSVLSGNENALGNLDMLKWYLSQGASYTANDKEDSDAFYLSGSLATAILRKDASMIRWLKSHGANITTAAFCTSNGAEMAALKAAGLDVNTQDDYSETLLCYHVRAENVEAVKSLLQLGANPNLRGADGKTPIEAIEDAANPDADTKAQLHKILDAAILKRK